MYNSRDMAQEFGMTHMAIKKVLKIYEVDFLKFGELIEEKIPIKITGGRSRKIIHLNEQHRILLLMYLSNKNEKIRKAKMELIS